MSQLISEFAHVLANTYTLYLKTQNYHWHVKGAQFVSLHHLFEQQYQQLAEEVDAIAERMLMKGHPAPATWREFDQLRTIQEGDSSLSANQMLSDLLNDHTLLINQFQKAAETAQSLKDEGSVNLLDELIAAHEKMHWMLCASKEDGCPAPQ